MDITEEFEILKKNYILKTLSHLNELEKLEAHDFRNAGVVSELALRQAESSTSFMELAKIIVKLKSPNG